MKRFISFAVLFLVFAQAAFHAHAGEAAVTFDSANKLYEEGKYSEAALAYDKLITSGDVSEALYFNRGNALLKSGQVGRAIASYRQAEYLAPRDSDLRANLQFARTRARGGSPYHPNAWTDWMTKLSVNEWTLLTAAALWTLFILLALGQWRKGLGRKLRTSAIAAGVLAATLAVCLGIALNNNLSTQSAIVVVGEADVRNGPLDESPEVYKVRDGVELNIIDEKDGWFQVVDSAERSGWMRRNQVLIFQPPVLQKSKS